MKSDFEDIFMKNKVPFMRQEWQIKGKKVKLIFSLKQKIGPKLSTHFSQNYVFQNGVHDISRSN